jgi:TolB-like 6-blade propeller-like
MKRVPSLILIYGFFIFLLIPCIVSCSKTKENELNAETTFFTSFPEIENLTFNNLSEYTEGKVGEIIVYDTALILLNMSTHSKYYFNNYSLVKKQLSKGYLRKGRGPDEAIGISDIGLTKSSLWALDITLDNVLQIGMDEALKEEASHQSVTKINNSIGRICMIDSVTYWLVTNLSSTKKISIGNLVDSDFSEETGDFNQIPSDIPLEVFKDAYSSKILKKPDGEKVVVAYRYTDALEIFNTSDKSFITIQGPEVFPVEYIAREAIDGHKYMAKTRKTRKAFVDGATTEKFIYLLYSGCRYYDKNWSYGQEIYVFDWNGTPVKRYLLDRYVLTIGVASDDSTIYSFDNNTGYIISSNVINSGIKSDK